MSRSCLIGAFSSLLLLILLVGLPTSEAVQCLHEDPCDSSNQISKRLAHQECPDICYRYNCINNGVNMRGFGCEENLKAACPITDADLSQLKNGTNINWFFNQTYNALSCQTGNCIDALQTEGGLMIAMGPDFSRYEEYQKALNLYGIKANKTCDFAVDEAPKTATPASITNDPPTTGLVPDTPTTRSNGTSSIVDDTPTNGTAASNATQAPDVDPTTNGSAALAGIPMILGWIIFELIAA